MWSLHSVSQTWQLQVARRLTQWLRVSESLIERERVREAGKALSPFLIQPQKSRSLTPTTSIVVTIPPKQEEGTQHHLLVGSMFTHNKKSIWDRRYR